MLEYRKYVYAVYKSRNFSKAAEALHVSQPWLSSAVKKTEQELGLLLFDRSTNPVSLTEAGRYYIEQIEKVSAIEADMEKRFAQMRAVSGQVLRIGSSMFFCTYVLPSLLRDFREEHPDVSLSLSEGSSSSQIEKLIHGDLDIVLEAEAPSAKQITSVSCMAEEIVLAVPARYRINRTLAEYCYTFDELLKRDLPGCRKPPVPLKTFSGEPFLLLNTENDIHKRSMEICHNAGFVPSVKLQLTQMMTAYYLVCEGQGITFLRSTIPEYVTPTDSIVFYEVDDPLASRNIYLSYPSGECPPLRQQLIDYMQSRIDPVPD